MEQAQVRRKSTDNKGHDTETAAAKIEVWKGWYKDRVHRLNLQNDLSFDDIDKTDSTFMSTSSDSSIRMNVVTSTPLSRQKAHVRGRKQVNRSHASAYRRIEVLEDELLQANRKLETGRIKFNNMYFFR
jgi:hypothetical protein